MSKPEGWACCSSVYSADDYPMTGGGDGLMILLKNGGGDMRQVISDAVNNYDVIIFDGSEGDFAISSAIYFKSLTDKTLVGVNGARLKTVYTVPEEVHALFDEMDVNSLNKTAGDFEGGTLTNGRFVEELGELTIRQTMIDRYGDSSERYRDSGLLAFAGCSNLILRNLDFSGPGSLDVGGADLLTLDECDHVWVDHCGFSDGLDGNFDIINNSDFITVSDTRFSYTEKSYNHKLCCLNSGSESDAPAAPKCNVSWIRCFWDEGCLGRMPFAVYGTHHLLNCYWNCTKGTCIDARLNAKLLVENSFFSSKVSNPLAIRDNTVRFDLRGSLFQGRTTPLSNADVTVPYAYSAADVLSVPFKAKSAGPVMSEPYSRALTLIPNALDFGKIYADNPIVGKFSITAFGDASPATVTLTAPEEILLSLDKEGEYESSIRVDALENGLIQRDIFVKANISGRGMIERYVEVSTPDGNYRMPITAVVESLEGESMDAEVMWPLDDGNVGDDAAITNPLGVFKSASCGLGEKIYVHSYKKIGDVGTLTLFNPTESIGRAADDECGVVFEVTTAEGLAFLPKKLRFKAARVNTDMCLIDVEISEDGSQPKKLLTAFQPNRTSHIPSVSEIALPLDNMGIVNALTIKISLYNMSENKQLALGDLSLEGVAYSSQSATSIITADDDCGIEEYYDLYGRRVVEPQRCGAYVKKVGKTNARLVIVK